MSFSISSLRELNKVHLLTNSIPPKEGTDWASGGTSWKVDLFSGGSVSLGGEIQYSTPLQSLVNSITNNKVVQLGMFIGQAGWGLAPQLDFAKKYLYSGIEPLKFSITGFLVVESSIQEDLIVPLEKLAYLTFPTQGDAVLDKVGDFFSYLGSKFSSLGEWMESFKDAAGAVYNVINGEKNQTESEGFNDLVSDINNLIGDAHMMNVPPTFNVRRAGSGLDFRYGNILISDVFIKSMKIDIPTLFYESGYPQAIRVDLSLETFRPLTSTAFSNMISGISQRWSDEEETLSE